MKRTLHIVDHPENPNKGEILGAQRAATGEVVFRLGSRDQDFVRVHVHEVGTDPNNPNQLVLKGAALVTIGGGLVERQVRRTVDVSYNTATRTGTIEFENDQPQC